MRRIALALSAALVAATGSAIVPAASAAPPATAPAEDPPSVPGQLLVGYEIGASASERASARDQHNARLLEEVVRGDAGRRAVELVALPSGANPDAAMHRFERNPNVAYAEPNWIVTHDATSNDPAYTGGQLWGMYGDATSPKNQYGSQAAEAWATGNTGSESVVVGVIDEGIDVSHPDLASNIWVNPYDAVDGVDNDRNGYVDDTHGWDFHNNDRTVYDGGNGDKHGTHVAGTIAGVGGNGTGVAGVAWDATMVSLKFLGPSGGYTSNAVKAIDYLTDLKTRHGIGVVASNNSWGGGGFSQALHDAIGRAAVKDVVFVAAAGNKGTDNESTPHYPSSYTNANIIAVASIDSAGNRSSFSNWGATSVDLGAPGTSILSTLPKGSYGTYSGTSMATPHVTGGLVLAAASGLTNLRTAILGRVVTTTSMTGKTVTGGRLDVSGFEGTPIDPSVNNPPTANDDAYSVKQDGTLLVPAPGVLSDDSDPDREALTVLDHTAPSHGSLVLQASGSVSYTPDSGYTGRDSFTYIASDGRGGTDGATVTIDVTAAKTKGGGGKPSGRPAAK